MFWLPSDLENAMYGLIVVYYVLWLQDEYWPHPSKGKRRVQKLVVLLYIISIMASFIITVSMLIQCKTHYWTPSSASVDEVWMNAFTFQFLALSVVLTWLCIAIQMRRREQRIKAHTKPLLHDKHVLRMDDLLVSQTYNHGVNKFTMVGRRFMLVIWVVVVSRTIYYCARRAGEWNMDIDIDASNNKIFRVQVFICLILWEVIPTSMTLFIFRRIPTTSATTGCGPCCCPQERKQFSGDYFDHSINYKPNRKRRRHNGSTNSSFDSTIHQSPSSFNSPGMLGHSPPHLHPTGTPGSTVGSILARTPTNLPASVLSGEPSRQTKSRGSFQPSPEVPYNLRKWRPGAPIAEDPKGWRSPTTVKSEDGLDHRMPRRTNSAGQLRIDSPAQRRHVRRGSGPTVLRHVSSENFQP